MSLVSNLLGKKPIREFTAVGAVPTIDGGGVVPVPSTKALRKKKRKKYVKEDDLIPSDAEELDTGDGTGTTADEIPDTDESDIDYEGDDDDLLDPSLALVLPDSTPNWDVPLSPAKVPSGPPQNDSAAAVEKRNASTAMSVSSMKKLTRGSREEPERAPDAVSDQTESFVSKVVPSTPVIPLTEDELTGRGRPMPEPRAPTNTGSSRMLNRFSFKK